MKTKDINLNDYEICSTTDKTITLRKKDNTHTKCDDLGFVNGVLIDDCSRLLPVSDISYTKYNRNIFIDAKHAKSALAMAQISQLMPYYGGTITDKEWGDHRILKRIILRSDDCIKISDASIKYNFLAFHTREQRDNFLDNNEQLVKDYLMIE